MPQAKHIYTTENNNDNNTNKAKSCMKYNLRGIIIMIIIRKK